MQQSNDAAYLKQHCQKKVTRNDNQRNNCSTTKTRSSYIFCRFLLAHLSRRLTMLAYRMGLDTSSVRLASTLSNMTISCMISKFGQIGPWTTKLAALERQKKIPKTYNGENDVITFSWLFLIGSFSYLQVMRTCIKALMSLNFCQIPPLTTELPLKRQSHHFFSVAIDPILFKLAGYDDMHSVLDAFEFPPD